MTFNGVVDIITMKVYTYGEIGSRSVTESDVSGKLKEQAPAPGAFDWVRQELLDQQDPWLVVADLGAYLHRQDEALAEFADPRAFTEKAILTLARARRFWVDRMELES